MKQLYRLNANACSSIGACLIFFPLCSVPVLISNFQDLGKVSVNIIYLLSVHQSNKVAHYSFLCRIKLSFYLMDLTAIYVFTT